MIPRMEVFYILRWELSKKKHDPRHSLQRVRWRLGATPSTRKQIQVSVMKQALMQEVNLTVSSWMELSQCRVFVATFHTRTSPLMSPEATRLPSLLKPTHVTESWKKKGDVCNKFRVLTFFKFNYYLLISFTRQVNITYMA